MRDAVVHVATTMPNSFLALEVGVPAFEARLEVSLKAVASYIANGYRVFALCDEVVKDIIMDRLQPNAHELVLIPEDPTKSMGFGRRQVIRVASNSFPIPEYESENITLWTEPEKDLSPYINDIILPLCADKKYANIVIPERMSLSSYPTFSQSWERIISKMASRIIGGEPQDYCFGPRALDQLAVKFFLNYPGLQTGLSDRHASIFCPLQDAKHAGLHIVGVKVDFQYPQNQRDAEEGDFKTVNKRIRVLEELSDTMHARQQWLTQAG